MTVTIIVIQLLGPLSNCVYFLHSYIYWHHHSQIVCLSERPVGNKELDQLQHVWEKGKFTTNKTDTTGNLTDIQ